MNIKDEIDIITKIMNKLHCEWSWTNEINGNKFYRFNKSIIIPDFGLSDNAYRFIFSIPFAKVFWGEEKYMSWNEGCPEKEVTKSECEENRISLTYNGNYYFYQPIWAFHLQQMVLCEEPLKYLSKFLE